MQFLLTASKDTYITDKIIDSSFSASDANVGKAATLDLFRLYNETFLTGTDITNELSRILIKFDYDQIQERSKIDLNLNADNFKVYLELTSIGSGKNTPSDFTVICFPLSQSFDEGIGRDVVSFNDIDVANFFTASIGAGSSANVWFSSGANAEGIINHTANDGYPDNIDIISSGNLNNGLGLTTLSVSQDFVAGTENLKMDITTIVSASMAGIIPNEGFRLSYSGSQEQDNVTRFVKRFASRHHSNPLKRPKLRVQYNDSIVDNHLNSYFNLSGSLFLRNFQRGTSANIVSGSSLTQVTGSECMILKLESGSFSTWITASQVSAGTPDIHTAGLDLVSFLTGVYSTNFAIDLFGSSSLNWLETIEQFVRQSGSITFDEIWGSIDGTVGYHTGTVVFKELAGTSFNNTPSDIDLIVTNAKSSYKKSEIPLIRVFVNDLVTPAKATKMPFRTKPVGLEKVYYKIIDARSGDDIVPFTKEGDATRCSQDSEGVYFRFFASSLPVGRTYTFRFLVEENGIEKIYDAKNVTFTVEK